MSKRIRHVWPVDGVAALFVNGTQDSARTPTHNMSFETERLQGSGGDDSLVTTLRRLYSYRTCVALSVIQPGHNEFMMLSSYSYSITTSRQLAAVRWEASHNSNCGMLNLINVPGDAPSRLSRDDLETTWNTMIRKAEHWYDKASRARSNRDHYLSCGNKLAHDADQLAKRFDMHVPEMSTGDYEAFARTVAAHKAHLRLMETIR